MRWCEAYIQMKENKAFVRRTTWGHKYFVWLKPEFMIQEDWCKDENLKKLVSTFGALNDEGKRVLKGEEAFSLFDGRSVQPGWYPRPEDRMADDWIVVNI